MDAQYYGNKYVCGAIVYLYEPETDSVLRGVIKVVQAESSKPGVWRTKYLVGFASAADPMLVDEKALHDYPSDAFPPHTDQAMEAAA